jgi:hypothetical protein
MHFPAVTKTICLKAFIGNAKVVNDSHHFLESRLISIQLERKFRGGNEGGAAKEADALFINFRQSKWDVIKSI